MKKAEEEAESADRKLREAEKFAERAQEKLDEEKSPARAEERERAARDVIHLESLKDKEMCIRDRGCSVAAGPVQAGAYR